MPHCGIGVDVIVGFPGETEENFLETYRFLNELDVSYLHVFPYSERANTTAKKMKDVVPVNVRMERGEMLRGLSEKKRMAFYREHLGTRRPVLFEEEERRGVMFGFTDNYIKVAILHIFFPENRPKDFLQDLDHGRPVNVFKLGEIRKGFNEGFAIHFT